MWDYLVKILKSDDLPKRPGSTELPRPADPLHQLRTSTDAEAQKPTHHSPPTGQEAGAVFCPLCHVRMRYEAWGSSSAWLCPECNGAFLSEAAVKELVGAVAELNKDDNRPTIYTPKGLE